MSSFERSLLYKVVEQGIHGIFRLQAGDANSKVLDFWQSNQDDVIIEYSPSVTVIRDLKKKGIH